MSAAGVTEGVASKKTTTARTLRPSLKPVPPITVKTTLGDLGAALGIEPSEVVAFLRENMTPCVFNHAALSVFRTAYICKQDGAFYESTCDAHADHAICPKCGAMSRRSGIRSKSG